MRENRGIRGFALFMAPALLLGLMPSCGGGGGESDGEDNGDGPGPDDFFMEMDGPDIETPDPVDAADGADGDDVAEGDPLPDAGDVPAE